MGVSEKLLAISRVRNQHCNQNRKNRCNVGALRHSGSPNKMRASLQYSMCFLALERDSRQLEPMRPKICDATTSLMNTLS